MSALLLRRLMRALGPAALCAAAAAASAQPPTARRADPLDAGAVLPPMTHESVLGRSPRGAESKPIPWRDANDEVARIGGWRAYAREAQQPEPAASMPAAAPARPDTHRPTPMPHRHGGPTTP